MASTLLPTEVHENLIGGTLGAFNRLRDDDEAPSGIFGVTPPPAGDFRVTEAGDYRAIEYDSNDLRIIE